MKLRAVLTGVEDEDEDEEEEEEEVVRWEEDEEDGAMRSEEDEEEEVLGICLSGLLHECCQAARPLFPSALSPPDASSFSLFTGRWFGLTGAPPSASPNPPAPPSVLESSDSEELDVSRDWPGRALKAWLRCSIPPLLAELLLTPPTTPMEEEVSKLRGPSCNGTFLISMLSFLSIRGAPQPSAAGDSGEEGVWLWPDPDFVDPEDNLLL